MHTLISGGTKKRKRIRRIGSSDEEKSTRKRAKPLSYDPSFDTSSGSQPLDETTEEKIGFLASAFSNVSRKVMIDVTRTRKLLLSL